MTSGRYGLVLREVGRLLGGGTASGLGAGPLLERFAVDRDPAAFEALVSRHGPMVLGTCRRMLDDPHDVDDAFQATFLVLARKAGSIRDADRLGPWLHGVARKIATRSRALSSRRRSRERPGSEDQGVEPPDLLEGLELRAVLDDELARLPEKYRAPLVLCYLEGLTHDEAAQQLRWPVGTVRSRLAGGRDRLRHRLTRRGLAPSAAVPAILSQSSIPQALLATTIRVATAAGTPSAHVASLVKGALIAMMWNKLKLVAAVGLMAGVTVGGAGVAAQQGGAGDKTEVRAGETPATPAQLLAEIRGLRAEERAIEQKIKNLRREHQEALLPLTKALEDLGSRDSELSQRWKKLEADTASTATDDRIKRLETRVLEQAVVIEMLRATNPTGKGAAIEPAAAKPVDRSATKATPEPSASPGKPEAKVDAGTGTPKVEPPAPQPIVHTLNIGGSMGGTPPLFAIISAERDRVTIIDSGTKERATFKMPKGATEIVPIVGSSLVSLRIKGPEVTRTALYDLRDKRWYEYDLKEPATEVQAWMGGSMMVSGVEPTGLGIKGATISRVAVFDRSEKKWISQDLREPAQGDASPNVTSTLVSYRIGRFIYRYSVPAKKWSVLELKRETLTPNYGGGMNYDGRTPIQDGDLIHLYDEKTGEWTHIDTKDDK